MCFLLLAVQGCVCGAGGCHRSPTSAEVASTPRSQGGSRASRRAPVPTAPQSPRFRRSTRVRPGEYQKASEERDTPTSPLCCRSLGTAACGARGTLLLVRLGSAEAHRGAARRGAAPPRVPGRENLLATRQSSGPQESWAHFGCRSSAPA